MIDWQLLDGVLLGIALGIGAAILVMVTIVKLAS